MALFELLLLPLVGFAFTRLALLGRPRPAPGWTELVAPGVASWLCGVQGLLFRRQPDYMVAYTVEARGQATAFYVLWLLLAVGVSYWASVRTRSGLRPRLGAAAFAGLASVGALGAVVLWPRLLLIGSTIELQQGLGRPLTAQPTARFLIGVTVIASALPLAGTALLLALDAFRASHRLSVSTAATD